MPLTLDFETRSAAPIKKTSYRVYASHPTTSILCIGLQWFGLPGRTVIPVNGEVLTPDDPCPIEVLQAIEHRQEVYAHNVAFDRNVWTAQCVERLGWPEIPFDLWRDSMAVCAYRALPRQLEKAAKALELVNQKDMVGHAQLLKCSQPRAHGKNAVKAWLASGRAIEDMPVRWWTDPARLELVYKYCLRDVETQTELMLRLGPLPEKQLVQWQLDQRINERGIPVDWGSLYQVNELVQQSIQQYNGKIRSLTSTTLDPGGAVASVNDRTGMLDWIQSRGHTMLSLKKAAVKSTLDDPALPEPVRDLLEYRQEAGLSSLAKLKTMLSLTDTDSRIRHSQVWHGAATGRLAGRGIQPHNFVRDALSEQDAELFHQLVRAGSDVDRIMEAFRGKHKSFPSLASSSLRSFFQASPGHKLLISDFSMIEVRVLAYLSGCTAMNDTFRTGGCVYSQFAAEFYQRPLSEIGKKSPERQLGKAAVLGLGYGMGVPKFITTAAGSPYWLTLEEDTARSVHSLYRQMFPEVPDLWRRLETAFTLAIQRKIPIVPCDRLAVGMTGDWAYMILPSKRTIWFYQPRIQYAPNPYRPGTTRREITYSGVLPTTKKWCRRKTYGGSLVESACQGAVACLVYEKELALEANRIMPILSVHDEIICEAVDRPGLLEEFHQIMRAQPDYAPTLSIECESHMCSRYGK